MKYKVWDRCSVSSLSVGDRDSKGRLFVSSFDKIDMSSVTFLHEGVDTVKQLYSGVLKPDLLEQIKRVYDLGRSHRLIAVLGREWLLGSGGSSGFRYRLQDSDTGIILFVGSRYALETTKHSHLKIELSPHFIDSRSESMIQGYMNNLASRLLDVPEPVGCAVHICVDFQGWEPPKNFSDILITRSRQKIDHKGISEINMSLSSFAVVYGHFETFLFGCADGLQCTLYRKDIQIKATGKVDFWESVWNRRSDQNFESFYDSSKPVWRLEFRFHHTVIKEFSDSVEQNLLSFVDLVPHLTGLFRYALGNFRLNAVSSSASSKSLFYRGVYIDPMWQLLIEDVKFFGLKANLIYKRKRDVLGQGGIRNLCLSVGNLTSIYARKGFTPLQSVKFLKNSGIWEDQLSYYRNKFPDIAHLKDSGVENFILKDIGIRLKERTLRGIAA